MIKTLHNNYPMTFYCCFRNSAKTSFAFATTRPRNVRIKIRMFSIGNAVKFYLQDDESDANFSCGS